MLLLYCLKKIELCDVVRETALGINIGTIR